jgi:hypothetical protein
LNQLGLPQWTRDKGHKNEITLKKIKINYEDQLLTNLILDGKIEKNIFKKLIKKGPKTTHAISLNL